MQRTTFPGLVKSTYKVVIYEWTVDKVENTSQGIAVNVDRHKLVWTTGRVSICCDWKLQFQLSAFDYSVMFVLRTNLIYLYLK